MKKLIITIVLALALLAGTVSLALAVTYGEPDGDGHPYVGLVLFYDEAGEYMWRCSGTLISPTVVLTAGHCTFGTKTAKVFFDADLEEGLVFPYEDCGSHTCYQGTPHPHPNYDDFATFPNTSDVGVVVLDEPLNVDKYGQLAQIGELNQALAQNLRKDIIIRTVGYGRQSVKPELIVKRIRYTATSMLVNLGNALTDGFNLQTSNNPSDVNGQGGSCFGDSGGPLFYPEDSNHVVAVVSFGMNGNCKGEDWSYRVDTAYAQDFVNEFLPQP